MDFAQFLRVLGGMLVNNGHFVGWLPVEDVVMPPNVPARGWLIHGRDGSRFLVNCYALDDHEAQKIVNDMLIQIESEDVEEAADAPSEPVDLDSVGKA